MFHNPMRERWIALWATANSAVAVSATRAPNQPRNSA
jgi:hypothetical protein